MQLLYHSAEVDVDILQPLQTIKTGHRGRPRKVINLNYLWEAILNAYHIRFTELAGARYPSKHSLFVHEMS